MLVDDNNKDFEIVFESSHQVLQIFLLAMGACQRECSNLVIFLFYLSSQRIIIDYIYVREHDGFILCCFKLYRCISNQVGYWIWRIQSYCYVYQQLKGEWFH